MRFAGQELPDDDRYVHKLPLTLQEPGTLSDDSTVQ